MSDHSSSQTTKKLDTQCVTRLSNKKVISGKSRNLQGFFYSFHSLEEYLEPVPRGVIQHSREKEAENCMPFGFEV